MEEKLKLLIEKQVINSIDANRIKELSERLLANKVPVIFCLRDLRKLFNIHKTQQNKFFTYNRKKLYTKHYILKKSGGKRLIESPNPRLKKIQYFIKTEILEKFNVSESATGFKKNSNIAQNAMLHTNKKVLINIDLTDFFPSINYEKVFRIFNYIGYTIEVSHLLTQLCTNEKNVLPQGSPCSPILSNLVCLKLDKRLKYLAKKIGADYTRYADDITFSGKYHIKKYLYLINKIISEEGYTINEKKFRISKCREKQEVTGLIVNKKVAIPKQIKKQLNIKIHFCNKFGVTDHMQKTWQKNYSFKNHVYGLAYFIKMVDTNLGLKYLKKLDNLNWLY